MMGAIRCFGLALAAWLAAAVPAAAQTVGLATTQGGATEQIATAIAKVVSEATDLQVRPQVLANTSQYLPLVNGGRVEFGIANYPQTSYSVSGTGMSEGQPTPNLRMVATLFPFNAGLVVSKASGMKGYADLKGKKVPRFPPNSLGDFIIRATLSTADLSYGDVTSVPTANFPRMYENMKQGLTDVAIATVGAQPTFDLEASLGGIRFLTFKPGDEPKIAQLLPGTYLRTLPAELKVPGMEPGIVVFAYDYTLFAGKDVPDAVVAKVAKAMHAGADRLKATSPLWAEYDPAKIAKDIGLPYHPGAIQAYREAGIWKGE